MLSQPLNSDTTRPRKRRLPEIDAFRGLAVGLMGMTHGLMWAFFRPVWADHIKYGGIFCCYTAFLLAFGMSLAISAQRGGFETYAQRILALRRTGTILFAYYLIACGRQLPGYLHSGLHTIVVFVLRLLLLVDVHGAGEFLLSFVLFLGVAAALGPRLRWLLQNPWWLLGLALAAHLVGQWLGPLAVPTNMTSYWRLLFGAQWGASRPFPVFPYAPLLAAGMLLARSYLATQDRRRWAAIYLKSSIILFTVVALLSLFVSRESPVHWARLEPIPGLGFLICSGALAAAIFALCVRYFAYEDPTAHVVSAKEPATAGEVISLPARFLIYVGRNSIWIIVWQYVCIQLGLKAIYPLHDNDLAFALFLAGMIMMPPSILYCMQWFGRRMISGTGLKSQLRAENVGQNSA